MSVGSEVERAARMLGKRYGEQTPNVLGDLLDAVPNDNVELLSLLRRILLAVEQQALWPH
jgi:hypothetical protein